MRSRIALVVSCFTVAVTAMSMVRSRQSWIRMADFPRLQVALLGTAALVHAGGRRVPGRSPAEGAQARRGEWRRGRASTGSRLLSLALFAAVSYQWLRIWRYTPLAPVEVEPSTRPAGRRRLVLLECNVRCSNRDAKPLLALVRRHAPDAVLCVETDAWWCAQLDALAVTYPYAVNVPRDNTYGLVLRSRLPLSDVRVEYLIEDEVPSIHARVRLRDGTMVALHCVHPRPPAPDKQARTTDRDGELMVVARRVRGAEGPVVVCGDLNDVAWSHTTRLFQKISGLLDPRKGRGFFSTFHADYRGCRFPLDHFFHSAHFRLVRLSRLPSIGSDHLPMCIELAYEPHGKSGQSPVDDDPEDWRQARATLAQADAAKEVGTDQPHAPGAGPG